MGTVEVSPKGVPVPRKPMEISSVGPDGPLLRGGGPTLEGTAKDVPRRLFRPEAGTEDPNPMEDPTAKNFNRFISDKSCKTDKGAHKKVKQRRMR